MRFPGGLRPTPLDAVLLGAQGPQPLALGFRTRAPGDWGSARASYFSVK